MLFHSLAILNAPVFEYKTTETNSTNTGLIQDIVATLRIDFVSQAQVERARNGAAGWCTAEILRADAETLLAQNDPTLERRAEEQLLSALTVARRQNALAWELRSAMSLARLWQRRGMDDAAQDLLGPVYRRFSEGFETPDLQQAGALLQKLARDRKSTRLNSSH